MTEITEEMYEALSDDACAQLWAADRAAVGTRGYAGVEYFWHYVYRHPLRDASFAERREVHARLLDEGVPVDGFGSVHDRVVEEVTGIAPTVDEAERAHWLRHHLVEGRP